MIGPVVAEARCRIDSMRTAECHPERRYFAIGLCEACYSRVRYFRSPEKHAARVKRWREAKAQDPGFVEVRRRKDRAAYAADPDKYRAKRMQNRNPEKEKAGHRKRRYGITPEQYEAMLKAQDGRCAVCVREFTGQKPYAACVDHDHATGIIRSLLCFHCNTLIGHAREDVAILERAITYLQRQQR